MLGRPGHWQGALYSQSTSGVVVTPETSLGLAAAFACINVLASDSAMLPFNVYKTRKSGGRDVATDFWPNQMLSLEASQEHDSITLRQATKGHALGWGNGYLEIARDRRDGRPLELLPLDPRWGETRPYRNKFSRIVYAINGQREDVKAIPQSDVIHIAGLGWDGLVGYSPVAMCRQAYGLGLAAEAMAGSLFGNGLNASGILKLKKKLTADGRKNLRESLEDVHGGPYNANRLLVLEEDTEYLQTTINPLDAQFLETRAFQVLEICRIYRVPPHKVMDLSEAHLANLEQSNTDYVQTSLLPWLVKWEQQCDRKLLTRAERMAGYCCRHDLSAFLRGDSVARVTFYKGMQEIGAMSPTQIAEKENLPPVEGGDIHILPLNMTTVKQMSEAADRPIEPPSADRVKDHPELPGTEADTDE